MGADRALEAVGRIERALARIEGAAARPASPGQADQRLAAAHARLRDKVEIAISQIDALLGAGETA